MPTGTSEGQALPALRLAKGDLTSTNAFEVLQLSETNGYYQTVHAAWDGRTYFYAPMWIDPGHYGNTYGEVDWMWGEGERGRGGAWFNGMHTWEFYANCLSVLPPPGRRPAIHVQLLPWHWRGPIRYRSPDGRTCRNSSQQPAGRPASSSVCSGQHWARPPGHQGGWQQRIRDCHAGSENQLRPRCRQGSGHQPGYRLRHPRRRLWRVHRGRLAGDGQSAGERWERVDRNQLALTASESLLPPRSFESKLPQRCRQFCAR